MTQYHKDSDEVIDFIRLFSRLKEWCDDEPEKLIELARKDDSIKEICDHLFVLADSLVASERLNRQLFAAPVNQKFKELWREYEDRYGSAVAGAWYDEIEMEMEAATESPRIDSQWASADNMATAYSNGVDSIFDFARMVLKEDSNGPSQDLRNAIEGGVWLWEHLKQGTGLDLKGIFRRRQLTPFVLVPKAVADRSGSAEKLSLLDNLQEAHDAFVFGATFAALALMRSLIEAVLIPADRITDSGVIHKIDWM